MQKVSKKINPHVRVRVTVLLRDKNGKICFARHLKNEKRYWLLPGGGQDPFESAKETAARELMEELNIAAQDFKLLFIRETMNAEIGRHIQFMVFEAINPQLSGIGPGEDPRVEGADFFGLEEIQEKPIYPAMKEDLIKLITNEPIESFKTLDWIP